MENPKNNPLSIPVAIVLAGALIAGAVFVTQGGIGTGAASEKRKASGPEGIRALFGGNGEAPAATAPAPAATISIRAPQASDHILGNPNADIVIVEYSDFECPFCRVFHGTMKRIMAEYGKDGTVAWIYRQFPLTQLHSKAVKEAEATECAAELGGNVAFWKYADRIFEVTPSNDGLDLGQLPAIAEYAGLDRKAFEACLTSGKHLSRIEMEYTEAASAGGSGTPFNVLLLRSPVSDADKQQLFTLYARYQDPRTGEPAIAFTEDSMRMSVSGAMPYEIMKATVDTLLK